jgi:hypothetical protein
MCQAVCVAPVKDWWIAEMEHVGWITFLEPVGTGLKQYQAGVAVNR